MWALVSDESEPGTNVHGWMSHFLAVTRAHRAWSVSSAPHRRAQRAHPRQVFLERARFSYLSRTCMAVRNWTDPSACFFFVPRAHVSSHRFFDRTSSPLPRVPERPSAVFFFKERSVQICWVQMPMTCLFTCKQDHLSIFLTQRTS